MNVEPRVAGPQSEPSVTAEPTPPSAPAVLDAEQRALLKAMLNRVVPARGDLSGAGDLDVGASIERSLAESARLRRLFLDGLVEVEISAHRRAGARFEELDAGSQTAVLEVIEEVLPTFFVALVEHAYRGYYTLRLVQRAVGWQPRPPQPLGYDLPPFDPSVLEQQRRRAPFWRRTAP